MLCTANRKPLGQLLLGRGQIKPSQLDRALDEQRRSKHQKLLGEILVEQQWCSEEQVTEALAEAYGVPYARVGPRLADSKIVSLLPKEFLERNEVLPLFLIEGVLTVAVAEPTNVFLVEQIERLSGCRVQIVAATARDIRATLQTFLPGEDVFVVDDIVDDLEPGRLSVSGPATPATPTNEPASKLVNYCIYHAARDGAAEIHFEPGETEFRVRYRIDGRLTEKLRPPRAMHAPVIARLKQLAGLAPEPSTQPQDGEIRLVIDNRAIDLRLATVPGRDGEKLVLRWIDQDRTPPKLEKLGFAYETLKQWRKLLSLPAGLILVSGPAGSGKRTTLYSTLRELNTADRNLCTLEDSIEYTIPGVNQFPLNSASGFTGVPALRAVLDQRPDVLMISALNYADTARLAAQAALDGCLVFATINTPDSASAIARLFHLGVEPYIVGAALAGVLAQRLVRKLCPACKEPHAPTHGQRRQIEPVAGPIETLSRPKGCPRCRHLGYTGLMGIHELLIPTDLFSERITQSAPVSELRDLSRRLGLKPLRSDGLEKIKAGITTLDELYRVTP